MTAGFRRNAPAQFAYEPTMSNARHTPGPWEVARCNTCGSANVSLNSIGHECDRLKAVNAELLAALEAMLDKPHSEQLFPLWQSDAVIAARAAIARARG